MSENIRELIERSSLGDPAAKALAARADPAMVARVMHRLAELEAAEKPPEAEPIIDRDSVIRRLGEALDMPPEAIELARTQPSIYGDAIAAHEELGDRLNAARELVADHIRREVEAQIRDGFGDLDGTLDDGEWLHASITCPREGCGWLLPIEYRDVRGRTTRLRGLLKRDRLCRAHLAEHEEGEQQ